MSKLNASLHKHLIQATSIFRLDIAWYRRYRSRKGRKNIQALWSSIKTLHIITSVLLKNNDFTVIVKVESPKNMKISVSTSSARFLHLHWSKEAMKICEMKIKA